MKSIYTLLLLFILSLNSYADERNFWAIEKIELPLTAKKHYPDVLERVNRCIHKHHEDSQACPSVYSDKQQKTFIIESCHEDHYFKKGIYLIEKDNSIHYYPWYQKQFNEWVCQEQCQDKCYYLGLRANINSALNGLIYFYQINLSEGYFNLKVLNEQLKIIDQNNFDYPS
ncbi:MAG: hypothetical protein SVR94_19555 [Pseudomonadota bacterium]|nr:hypothetical protein [Pseudomonadota bacterium]